MKKLSVRVISFLVVFIAFASCGDSEVYRSLDDIESYLMERPDSALAALDSMDRALLVTDRLKAQHALLHAMALDKNFIDVSDDSIAKIAVDYYSRRGPARYYARALYYLGLSYYYTGDYKRAILEYTKAENIAERSDSLYLGFVKVAQADTYSKTHNNLEETRSLQEACEIYASIREEYYLKVAELRLSQALLNQGYDEEGKSLLNRVINTNGINDNARLSAVVTDAFYKVIQDSPDYASAVCYYDEVYEKYDGRFMKFKDYWAYAYALNKIGRKSDSHNIVTQLSQIDSSGTASYWKYLLKKDQGMTSDALALLESYLLKNNTEISLALRQSLALLQRDYYESQAELYQYKGKNRTLVLVCVTTVSILLITVLLFIILRYVRIRDEEKERYLQYANEVKRQLEESRNENYPALKKKYLELYRSKFETIGYLYEEYAISNGKSNAANVLYKKIAGIIAEFRNSYEENNAFEEVLNRDFNNIMLNLRNEVPDLKEVDYRIFSFALVGFDVTTISYMLDISMNAVYIRRSRIRKSIEETNPVHKCDFLEII